MKLIKLNSESNILDKYKKLKNYSEDYLILESIKVIQYAQKLNIQFEEVVSHHDFFKKNLEINSKNNYVIGKSELSNFIGYSSHSGVFALIKKPKPTNKLSSRILILDRLTSPENVGSIASSACAFGFKTIIFDNKGASPYLRRCIRVSTGHVLALNIKKSMSLESEIENLKSIGYEIICSHNSIKSKTLEEENIKTEKIAIIIGSEGHGVSDEIIKLADHELKINTDIDVEHLNASNASSIIMHHFKKIN
jgi:RNA methyltransferase, TrmH family